MERRERAGARCARPPEAELREILDAWFAAEPSGEADDRANVGHLSEIEQSSPAPRRRP